jgi:polysaccharide biosynthesis/export protein
MISSLSLPLLILVHTGQKLLNNCHKKGEKVKKLILFSLLCAIGLILSMSVFAQGISSESGSEGTEKSAIFEPEKVALDRKTEQITPDVEKTEQDFRQEEKIEVGSGGELSRFGERFFRMPVSTFAPITEGPVDYDYVLGPGDELIIEVWGMVDMREQVTIDKDGGIFLPQIGRISLVGIPFQRAENLIKQQFGKYYTGFELAVTISRLRSIKIFVLGEAKHPGTYELSPFSTLFHALYLSGGPSSIGSMRKIQLIRAGEKIGTTDAYQFLLYGQKKQDYKLQPGDIIFIPLAGPMVSIEGDVRRPAIYELNEEKNLLDIISLAGEVRPSAYDGRIQIERIDKHNKKSIVDIRNVLELFEGKDSEKNIPLQDGDFIRIFPVDPLIYNKIFLEGFVKYPGIYQWKTGLRLSNILTPETLRFEAYLKRAEIERIEFPSMETKIYFFSPEKLFNGDETEDVFLQPLDRVKILSEWREPETIVLKGEVRLPGEYTIKQGERLSSVLERAGGFTEEAFLQGAVFTRESVKIVQKENINRLIRTQEEMLIREVSVAASEETASEKAQLLVQQKRLISLLASYIPMGRIPVNLRELDKFKGSPGDLILEEGDTLLISKPPMVINVVGAVNNTGAVLWAEGKNVDYYIGMCGGLTRNADRKQMFVIKSEGTAVSEGSQAGRQTVQQGDIIIIPEEIKITGWRQIVKDISAIFYNIALPVSYFLK